MTIHMPTQSLPTLVIILIIISYLILIQPKNTITGSSWLNK